MAKGKEGLHLYGDLAKQNQISKKIPQRVEKIKMGLTRKRKKNSQVK
jgi:hypothetical protein